MKLKPNKLFLLPAVALFLAPVATPAQSYTWGTTLVTSGNWMGGHGVNVYWNGTPGCNPGYVGGNSYTTYNGTQYYTGEEYQCGELPFRLYTTLGWYLGAWPDTYAYQMYTSPPSGMQTHANGSGYIPVPGDCVVWNTGAGGDVSGHVAVVNYVDGGHVYLCEQNMCNYGTSILDRSGTGGSTFAREDGWGAGYLLGCVHSPNNSYSYSNSHVNPCVAKTSDGRLEVFVVGNTGNLYHAYQTSAGGSWSGWNDLGGAIPANAQITAANDQDGRIEVFFVNTSGVISHLWQLTAGSSASNNWSGIYTFSSSVSTTAKLAIGKWGNGVLDLFVVGTDNVLYHNYQTAPNGGWFGFATIGGSWQQDSDIAVGNESDGRLEIFVVGNTGNLYNNWQNSANSTNWHGFNSLSGAVAENDKIAVARDTSGRLNAFLLGTDGVSYRNYETASNSPTSWNGWSSMGGLWETDAKTFASTDKNGAIEVFLIGSSGNLYHNYQSGSTWSGWVSIGGNFTQNIRPCVGQNNSGTLEVFQANPNSGMQHAYQTAANSSTWSGWSSLGGTWQ